MRFNFFSCHLRSLGAASFRLGRLFVSVRLFYCDNLTPWHFSCWREDWGGRSVEVHVARRALMVSWLAADC